MLTQPRSACRSRSFEQRKLFTKKLCVCRGCREDAEQFCNASFDWHVEDNAQSRLVFPCLVRYLYGLDDDDEDDEKADVGNPKAAGMELSEKCADQVERVLEQRAISVKLHPDIEDACRPFLVQRCVKHTRPGEELQCLQVRGWMMW